MATLQSKERTALCLVFLLNLCCFSVARRFHTRDVYYNQTIFRQNDAYQINENIIVHEGATLTIEPGVKMVFQTKARLIVNGDLVARGTPTARIMLTRTSPKKSQYRRNKPSHGSIRLVEGNWYNEGRLQVFHRGYWGTVCNKGWTDVNSQVACRELGFAGGTLTNQFGGGLGYVWLDKVQCKVSDLFLRSCRSSGLGNAYCIHRHDVGLICSGPIARVAEEFPLISIKNSKQALLNIDITEVELLGQASSSDTTAISCGICFLENVTISGFNHAIKIWNNSAGLTKNELTFLRFKRIKIEKCSVAIWVFNHTYDSIELDDVNVTNCKRGLFIEKAISSFVKITGGKIEANYSGIHINVVKRNDKLKNSTICGNNYENVTMPVLVDLTAQLNNCTKVFTAQRGHVLHLYIKYLSQLNLKIYSGSSSNVLLDTTLNKWYEKQYVRSTSNQVTVEVTGNYSNNSGELYIVSRPATENIISGTVINGSRSGIKVRNIYLDVFEIKNCNIHGVFGNGISITGKMSTVRVLNNIFESNTGQTSYGSILEAVIVLSLETNGDYNISGNIFRNNKHNLVHFLKCDRMSLEASKNTFLRNTGSKLISVVSGTYSTFVAHKVNIIQNSWKSNFAKYSMLNFGRRRWISSKSEINTMTISNNQFSNNTGENIVNIESISSNDVTKILWNTWQNNVAKESLFRYDISQSTTSLKKAFFAHNILVDNLAKAAIVYIRGNITFSKNIFENPNSRYEFVTKSSSRGEIDGRYNWWGSRNPCDILSRILDFYYSREMSAVVKRYPILASRNTSDVMDIWDRSLNTSVICGSIETNITLTKSRSPYLVTKDVVILPNATLVVEKGVHINVLPNVGFDVYGKLEMVGAEDDVISFNVGHLENKRSSSAYPLGYWRGIRFRQTAKRSQLINIKFERAGSSGSEYNFVLHFDILRQTTRNIEIKDFAANGIKVITAEPDLIFTNFKIRENKLSSGIGIQCFSPSCTCLNCTISNLKGTGISVSSDLEEVFKDFYKNALPIPSSADSRAIRDVCDLVVTHTYIGEDDTAMFFKYERDKRECVHILNIAADATITITGGNSYKRGNLSISKKHTPKEENATVFIAQHGNDVFSTGPGLLYITFGAGHDDHIKIFIFTRRDKQEAPLRRLHQIAKMENSVFRNCDRYGVTVDQAIYDDRWEPYFDYKKNYITSNVLLRNCHMIGNGIGVKVHNFIGRLEVQQCYFSENLGTALFVQNQGQHHTNHSIIISNSSFERNEQSISLNWKWYWDYKLWPVKSYKKIIIRNNNFTRNSKTVIEIKEAQQLIYGSTGHQFSKILIHENLFSENNLSNVKNGIMEVTLCTTSFVEFTKNVFVKNRCSFVGKSAILSYFSNTFVRYIKNTFYENEGLSVKFHEIPLHNISSFTLGIFGFLRNYEFYQNIFNNRRMNVELFVASYLLGSMGLIKSKINAKYNWWGVSSAHEIKNKIFDFETWNDRPKVEFLPAASSENFSDFFTSISDDKLPSFIGGYLNTSTQLTIKYSPYFVTSDLTVGRHTNLTIDPGVELLFYPRVGILVLGSLFVMGKSNNQVKLCSMSKKCSLNTLGTMGQDVIRLSDGPSKFSGRLDIYVENMWQTACSHSESFSILNIAIVACRQLGYGRPGKHFLKFYYDFITPPHTSINCFGNESSILDCRYTLSNCESGYGYYVECEKSAWGNVRILDTGEKQSSLEHVHIDDTGALHMNKQVSSIQVINGSLSIKHVKITNSNGIEIISPRYEVKLDNVTLTGTNWSTPISIIDNLGYVDISRATIYNNKRGGILIAGMKDIPDSGNYFGLPSFCDTVLNTYVKERSYMYFPERSSSTNDDTNVQCQHILTSPINTTMILRLLIKEKGHYFRLRVFDGNTSSSSLLQDEWYLSGYSSETKEIRSSTNFLYLVLIFGVKQVMAEILVIDGKGSNNKGTLESKRSGSVTIVGSKFETIDGPAVHYSSDLTSTNLTISRCQFSSLNSTNSVTQTSVKISANNKDHIEISNNFFHNNVQGGIHIDTKSNKVKGVIKNNIFTSNNGSDVILVKGSSGSSAYFVVAGNYLKQNDLKYSSDLISIKNVWVTIQNNTILDNTARYILYWEGGDYINQTTGSCLNNIFYLNNGYRYITVLVKGTAKIIRNNYFVNPENTYEIGTWPSADIIDVINVTFNWWGDRKTTNIMKKIGDKRFNPVLPVVNFKPFLQNRGLFYQGSCPLGWISVDKRCFLNQVGAQTYKNTEKNCKKHGGKMIKINPNDKKTLNKLLKKWHFNFKKLVIWITQVSVSGKRKGCLAYDGKTFSFRPCDSLYPSICERTHETCVGFEQCQCDNGWRNATCGVPVCIDLNNCSSNGICIGPNKCQCYDDYDGDNCTDKVHSNLNAPVFHNIYNVNISEKAKQGFHILTVFANDSDPGRSGQVVYNVIDDSFSNYFVLDSKTGQIVVSRDDVLDYERLAKKRFVFTITATDNGIPPKSSDVKLTINVVDENDNCPVFKTLPGNYKLPLIIQATDDDSGKNGKIDYTIDEDSDQDKNFYINVNKLLNRKVLQPGKYPLEIVAQDRGDPPCGRQLLITVLVLATTTPTLSSPNKTILSVTSEISATLISTPVSKTSSHVVGKTLTTSTLQPLTSSTLQRLTSTTLTPSPTSYKTSTSDGSISSQRLKKTPTSVVTSSTIIPPKLKAFHITIRLTNKVFTSSLQDETSTNYKSLKTELENILSVVWQHIGGFYGISDLVFKKGSVIAEVKAEFKLGNKEITTNDLVLAIINATDDQGNIGQLKFDVSFLKRSMEKEPENESSNLVWIIPLGIMGFLGFIILIIYWVCCFKRRLKTESRVGPPVELHTLI